MRIHSTNLGLDGSYGIKVYGYLPNEQYTSTITAGTIAAYTKYEIWSNTFANVGTTTGWMRSITVYPLSFTIDDTDTMMSADSIF